MTPKPAPEICPVCGEDVPRNALACPECGADHNSGWREDADTTDAVGGTGDDFDYNEFVQEEFGTGAKPRGISTIWWISAIVLLLALALMWLYAAC
jgi:endogenous inhibitor of DNA gyrase (YacG/DUF329 family)